jgi:ubiquinone/menaquinone biosynthesis C-methylase UbiE
MASNPFSTPQPWDLVSTGYARTSRLFLEQFAAVALESVQLSPQLQVLDVACGPGTLALMAACRVQRVTALDFSPAMLAVLRQEVLQRRISNIDVYEGDGQALPFDSGSFDAAFSMFGLMFFPDRPQGFAELHRILKPGGMAVVSSWAPAEESPLMRIVFGAIRAMAPETPDSQKSAASLDDPEVFRREMDGAGFKDVRIERVRKSWPVPSIETFWAEMADGHAGLAMLKEKWGPTLWNEKQPVALRHLRDVIRETPTALASDAWIATGRKE